jgi:hypothetical protein
VIDLPMDLSTLITMAEAALDPSVDGDRLGDLIEKYAAGFDSWQSTWVGTPLEDKAAVQRLLSMHEAVVRRAETATTQAQIDLGMLRKRGKGILSYADALLPNSPTRPSRKG